MPPTPPCACAAPALRREVGALYLHTRTEPWLGRCDNPELPPSDRSAYSLREEMLAQRMDRPAARPPS